MTASKLELRQKYRKRRAAIDMQVWADDLAAALLAWDAWREATWVGGYVPLGDEPPLPDHSGLAVPRAQGGGFVYALPHDGMVAGAWRVPQPDESARTLRWDELDLVLVPGLAFDRRGGRLGRGGGVYDRALAQLPARVHRVGVAHPNLIDETLPTEPHDVAMTHLIIGHEVVSVRSSARP